MPFIQVGSGDDLILTIPTDRTTNWGANFKANFATKIAEHNHSGSGNGQKLSGSSFAANSINGSHILLANDEYLKGRNFADSANINIIKVNASDKIETIADFSVFNLINDAYIKARNNADSDYINIIKVKTDDTVNILPDTEFDGSVTLNDYALYTGVDFLMANNQSSAADITGATTAEVEGTSFKFSYKVVVDATADLLEKGESEFTYINGSWQQVRGYSRDNSQVVFSIVSGQLKYTTPSYAGFVSATLSYQSIII